MAASTLSGNCVVLDVVRSGRIVEKVVIRNWPFDMTFLKLGGKVKLMGFIRYDGCQDEFYWIPRQYFTPAIKKAWAIFEKSNIRAS